MNVKKTKVIRVNNNEKIILMAGEGKRLEKH